MERVDGLKVDLKAGSELRSTSPSDIEIYVQGDQLNMAVFLWYLEKSDLSSVRVYPTLDKSLFTRNQKNTAMLIWSGCTIMKQ